MPATETQWGWGTAARALTGMEGHRASSGACTMEISAGRVDRGEAGSTVLPFSREDDADDTVAELPGSRPEENIRRRTDEVLLDVARKPDQPALEKHVSVRWRHVDATGLERLTVERMTGRERT